MIKAILIGAVVGVAVGCTMLPAPVVAKAAVELGCFNPDMFDAYCITGKGPEGTTVFRCMTKDGKEHRFFDGGEA